MISTRTQRQQSVSMVGVPSPSSQTLTTSGVRQSCVLAPALLCIEIDGILSRCVSSSDITIGSAQFTDLDYADELPCSLSVHHSGRKSLLPLTQLPRQWACITYGQRLSFRTLVMVCLPFQFRLRKHCRSH